MREMMALSVLSTSTLLLTLSNFSDKLNISEIRYYEVFVLKLNGSSVPTKHPSTLTAADFTDYATGRQNQFIKPYKAAEFPKALFDEFRVFTLGDESVTNRSITAKNQLKGDPSQGYYNGPLTPGTYYTGFQRACINDSSCQSDSWFVAVKTTPTPKSDDSVNVGLIVGVVLGVAAGIMLLLFLPLYFVKYRDTKAAKKKKGRHRSTVRRLISGRFFADPRLPVTYEDFLDHVSRLRFEENKGFIREFSSFDHKVLHEHLASSNPQNMEKNRFYNIPAYDHSRVKLEVINDVPTSDYIHANIVSTDQKDKAYIATQAPLPDTIPDFWRMIWEHNVQTVVMLNNLVEKGEQACTKYWPERGEVYEAGDITITVSEVTEFACYLVRCFELKRGPKGKSRRVKHFHYTNWPAARDVPQHPLPFLEFVKRVNSWTPSSEDPMVVHCISGTGRTGVFIVVNNQLRRVDQRGDLSIFFNVEEVCDERFQGIKSLAEYIFIHDCVLEYFSYRDMTDIPLNGIMDHVEEISNEKLGVSQSQLDFEKLSRANAKTEHKSDAGNMPGNRAKNRFETVLPFDATRVVLKKSKSLSDDYINASFVDSFFVKGFFIATQAPLADTIFNFWRMIWEQDVRSIAILLEKEMFPPSEVYWPDLGLALEAAHFQIKALSFENINSFDLRQVTVTNTKTDETRHLRMFHIKKWPNDKDTETGDLQAIISMIQQCKLWNGKAKGKKILVHCSSGCGRTGVFIAINNAMEQAEFDKAVNVFNIVRRLRQQRIVMIQTKNQYELVYRGVTVYFKHFYRSSSNDGPESGQSLLCHIDEESSEEEPEEEQAKDPGDKVSLIGRTSNKSVGDSYALTKKDSQQSITIPPTNNNEQHEMESLPNDIVVELEA